MMNVLAELCAHVGISWPFMHQISISSNCFSCPLGPPCHLALLLQVCMAYGYSAMVFDQRVFVTYNPFNLYVTQVRHALEGERHRLHSVAEASGQQQQQQLPEQQAAAGEAATGAAAAAVVTAPYMQSWLARCDQYTQLQRKSSTNFCYAGPMSARPLCQHALLPVHVPPVPFLKLYRCLLHSHCPPACFPQPLHICGLR